MVQVPGPNGSYAHYFRSLLTENALQTVLKGPEDLGGFALDVGTAQRWTDSGRRVGRAFEQ